MGGRRRRGTVAATAALGLAAALAPAAHGATLGTTEQPPGASEVPCYDFDPLVGFQATETTATWTASRRSLITSWSTNVTAADPGESVSLVALRAAGPNQAIVAVDTATVPQTPPAGGVATFRPASRIVLEPGDRLGISGTFGATCGWEFGAIPASQSAAVGEAVPGVAPGATVTLWVGPRASSQLNLAAETAEGTDVRVSAAAGPANVVTGALGQLSATVTNAGAAATPVTVTDEVPAGLRVETAVAGGGSCAVAAQRVTCEIASLAPGASVPVVVLVTPTAPGTFSNTVAAEPLLDNAPADNAATATLTAVAPPQPPDDRDRDGEPVPPPKPTPSCVVPKLTRTPLGVARGLLRQLDCRPGRVTKARSRTVPKGAVISTRPGRGQYRAGSAVRIVVSSGKPPRKAARGGGAKGRARR